jgi:hypothetical protein
MMIPSYPMESEVPGSACEQFESLVCQLIGEAAGQMQHGPIEALLFREGTELLRRLMQAYLDLRAGREPPRHDVTSPEGVPLTHCRSNCERQFMALFGEVMIRRKGYSRPGVPSLFPLGGELNLPKDQYSHGLRYGVAEEAAVSSL